MILIRDKESLREAISLDPNNWYAALSYIVNPGAKYNKFDIHIKEKFNYCFVVKGDPRDFNRFSEDKRELILLVPLTAKYNKKTNQWEPVRFLRKNNCKVVFEILKELKIDVIYKLGSS